ncbi:GspE/PulE family protein [Noviherbaspirillum galbum]|uniref:Flp pilus assembly complex ATPase component n=1 Tax=Noviherbaspirillum galbum TaxID=2709383 RepID=A0A6B3SWL3_9BURK|nr:ATPase, T2SS/T4P/T4SS family [Noviherbaspirillum galbum]NEX63366.1 Flp pilus assembly complex ATPase component [Noviherbaspirillum galbum]
MWFSKIAPISRKDSVPAAQPTASGARTVVRPVAQPRPTPTAPIPLAPVLNDMSSVPPGPILNQAIGLSVEWNGDFAIIEDRPKTAAIVCSERIYGKAGMHEVMRVLDQKGFHSKRLMRATAEIIKVAHERASASASMETLDSADATDTERIAGDLINQAVEKQASDIHIETRDSHADVMFRINGVRVFHRQISKNTAKGIGVVINTVHGDNSSKDVTWDDQQVSDCTYEHTTPKGQQVQVRFSSMPIHPSGNFEIVMRVLVMDEEGIEADRLGYTGDQLAMLASVLAGATGMVIFCGPTNSGKSTTLQAALRMIHQRWGTSIKIQTVEDPVEYRLVGGCQSSVARNKKKSIDANTGSAFTTFLRGALRQDPDVMMVGEIRDAESATIVKDMVLSGRKLLTTLHTYSAMRAFVRLRELGVPMDLLTMPGFISCIVYQRLVPLLCQQCAIPLVDERGANRLPPDVEHRVQQVTDLSVDDVKVRGDGCPHCNHTGYVGRTVCAEFVVPDHRMLQMLSDEKFIKADEYWQSSGLLSVDGIGVTALAHGISKIKRGLIDPLDVEAQINLLTSDVVASEQQADDYDMKDNYMRRPK